MVANPPQHDIITGTAVPGRADGTSTKIMEKSRFSQHPRIPKEPISGQTLPFLGLSAKIALLPAERTVSRHQSRNTKKNLQIGHNLKLKRQVQMRRGWMKDFEISDQLFANLFLLTQQPCAALAPWISLPYRGIVNRRPPPQGPQNRRIRGALISNIFLKSEFGGALINNHFVYISPLT